MSDVVIVVSGGVVQDIFTRDPVCKVSLIDWDNYEENAPRKCASSFPCHPLAELPDETAILLARD